ncbi:MAG: MBL fold metallo-hydrolase [Dehalococcoidales bacterium]|jgi:ribonuclease BN (tRNA processing enzyme)
MDIRILGAHNNESTGTSCVTFLVDGTLAVEAGGLTSRLTMEEQQKLDAVIVTHHHLDHIRDIPGLALNLCRLGSSLDVYTTPEVGDVIKDHMLNAVVYPDFQNIPEKKPTLVFLEIEPYGLQWIDGHSILPVPVHHSGQAVGYQISDKQGKTLFYTGDTGPGLNECWRHVSPQLLIIEVTFTNACEEMARQTGHLTARLLEQELVSFREIKGYLPEVLAIHLDAVLESTIREELAAVAANLQIPITVAREEMRLTV